MKKILLLAILCCGCLGYSQNKVSQNVQQLQDGKTAFRAVKVLDVKPGNPDQDIRKVVANATMASLKMANVNEVAANQYEHIALEIPYGDQILSVLLYKVNPFAEGFHIDTDKATNIAYQKGAYYRGILDGDYKSVAAFNFFNGEMSGIVSSASLGNLVVGKLDIANNTHDYIVYSDAEMKVLNQFDCQYKDEAITETETGSLPQNREIQSTRCVTMYFEVDNNLYLSNGSNITTTSNWMTSVFNNMQTLYNNDGISIALKSFYIWTTPDPYNNVGTTSGAYLNLFHQTRPVFDGDLGQLIGIDPGGLGGLAVTINGLCNGNNYCYSDVNFAYSAVPTYSWTINVITHELGHLMGSRHTHACVWNGNFTSIDGCGPQAGYTEGSCDDGPIPSSTEKGTIMSYCHLVGGVGINLANGFGPQPAAAILNRVNNGPCLSFDCMNTCINTVSAINTTAITPTSVSFSWTDLNSSQTSWEVAVTPFASSAITWQTVNTNSFSVSGLNPNAYYRIRVRPLCSAGLTATPFIGIFATTVADYCLGTSFTDTGGASGNYTDNEAFIRTMVPTGPGLSIRVTFTTFNLETDFDYLYIYDGPDTTYPEVTGGLTGTTLPVTRTSTDASGALTFRFYSDQGVVRSGWNATISCTGSLGLPSNDFIDFSYAPNPTGGNVAITSRTEINEVSVYNVTGQLLYKNNLRSMDTNVDVSSFATGTYFFKLRFEGGQEANFKVLKN